MFVVYECFCRCVDVHTYEQNVWRSEASSTTTFLVLERVSLDLELIHRPDWLVGAFTRGLKL